MPMATREGTGPSKRLEASALTQTRDCLDEQQLRTGSGEEGEQGPRSAQQEEEGPLRSNQGRTQRRKSSGKETEERREGANEGEYTEDEPVEWQGQVAPQNRGSQRLTQGPHTQSDSDGALPVEEEGNGNQNGRVEGRRDKDFTEGPNESRLARWNEETTNTSPYTEANIWEKQTWEVEPPNHRNINNAQRSGKWLDSYPNNDMDRIGSSYPDAKNPHDNRPLDIV